MKMSGTGLIDASSLLHLEVSSEVSKQAQLEDPKCFRVNGLRKGVFRLRPPPPNNGPKTTD